MVIPTLQWFRNVTNFSLNLTIKYEICIEQCHIIMPYVQVLTCTITLDQYHHRSE